MYLEYVPVSAPHPPSLTAARCKSSHPLRPVVAADYAATFSAAELTRLQAAFPGGACDWSKPDNQTGVVVNGSFGPSAANLVFDVTK